MFVHEIVNSTGWESLSRSIHEVSGGMKKAMRIWAKRVCLRDLLEYTRYFTFLVANSNYNMTRHEAVWSIYHQSVSAHLGLIHQDLLSQNLMHDILQ